jgi:hypothetical protein
MIDKLNDLGNRVHIHPNYLQYAPTLFTIRTHTIYTMHHTIYNMYPHYLQYVPTLFIISKYMKDIVWQWKK